MPLGSDVMVVQQYQSLLHFVIIPADVIAKWLWFGGKSSLLSFANPAKMTLPLK
jgi:hypothetical protein